MNLYDILFSVNDYDRDGDINDEGIFLHFAETKVKVADNLDEFKIVVERIAEMTKEIEENYPEINV